MSNSSLYGGGLYGQTIYGGGSLALGASSSDDIVYNNYGFQNASHLTRWARHESGPQREFVLSPVPRGDGMNLQASYDKQKIIPVTGAIVFSTNAELLAAISEIKKFLHPANRTLKITEGAQTRYYTATCTNIDQIFTSRDHDNIDWLVFNLEFSCWSPYGRDGARAIQQLYSQTAANVNMEAEQTGEVRGALISYVQFDAASSVTAVTLANLTNNDQLKVTRSFSAGDILIINGEAGTIQVTVNGVPVDHEGRPPRLEAGSNSLRLTTASSSHTLTFGIKFYQYYL